MGAYSPGNTHIQTYSSLMVLHVWFNVVSEAIPQFGDQKRVGGGWWVGGQGCCTRGSRILLLPRSLVLGLGEAGKGGVGVGEARGVAGAPSVALTAVECFSCQY